MQHHMARPGLVSRPMVGAPALSSRRFMQTLDLGALDSKWQQVWKDKYDRRRIQHNLYNNQLPPEARADERKESCPKFIVPMFPYPSGSLHMGHLRVYTIADVIARYRRMKGDNVALPIGWDAFGLPAENAAREHFVAPRDWTNTNIANMKLQLQRINAEWDWDRELSTCDPKYYVHTQRIFISLYQRGLIYQNEAEVNWDPLDETVLANEQVDTNGCSWRSGAKVVQKKLRQWFIRITAYKDALHDGLAELEKNGAWPSYVTEQQRSWMGKVAGHMVKFPLLAWGKKTSTALEAFVEQPTHLFGAQFLALSPKHPLAKSLGRSDAKLQSFMERLETKSTKPHEGYRVPSLQVINPMMGEKYPALPIFVCKPGNGREGPGATIGVPGHNKDDHGFWAENFSGMPVRVAALPPSHRRWQQTNEEIVDELRRRQMIKPFTRWRLRDWLISRQRYWGTPIPIVHCKVCGAVPVPEEKLPVLLPNLAPYHWTKGKRGNPLESASSWINTPCPTCNLPATRDTDTMDTFVDSSWYYGRYADPDNPVLPWGPKAADMSLPIDTYIGGVEHSILHLLYTRFIYKALANTPHLYPKFDTMQASMAAEPLQRLITQGMVHGKTYIDPRNGKFLAPAEVDLSDAQNPKVLATGAAARVSFEKMSKSKHNGVDPTACIDRHGADATRAHMLFLAPVNEVLDWDETSISGVTRWLHKVYDLVQTMAQLPVSAQTPLEYLEHEFAKRLASTMSLSWNQSLSLWRMAQKTIGLTCKGYDNIYALNTVVSTLMKLRTSIQTNELAHDLIRREATSILVRLMAPITPAFAEECWHLLFPAAGSVFEWASFPIADGSLQMHGFQGADQVCALHIDGKLAARLLLKRPMVQLSLGEMDEWTRDSVLATSVVLEKYNRDPIDLKKAESVHVAKRGAMINFVMPKTDRHDRPWQTR
ncbi:hypothetical protein CDD81_5836 [Ophiocordyceps australis]|uniref:leucine--tRNA ligase n=1 Tax=Ophiocordyceps australis TaxID=1399860 RepID=A0A2C5Y423_9HYPO|nr:hypothetical protein CDD81_5836 [Ophiocordyceps australis]